MGIDEQLRNELAATLGIIIIVGLHDSDLGKALTKWEKLRDDAEAVSNVNETPTLEGAFTIMHNHDSDLLCTMMEVVGMCVKHPDRKTWFIGTGECLDLAVFYWFPTDSIEEATALVKKDCTRLRKLIKAAK